eukprot:TRINITY_DN6069_c0_g4_i3.p1 TRINITY_DN6069_c0_g4~~TRINITY_DN6069_c0_g4_i3.p1  ORF type:complete len:652 (-),score=187.44 TRINITY_DN6069_c0_g4_i3:687-2642(-)
MIAERLFTVFDCDSDSYLNSEEFVYSLIQFYSREFSTKLKLVFALYDFDADGYVSKEDVRLLLSYVPIKSSAETRQEEGRLTFEGAGTEEFLDRVQSQLELDTLLDIYFAGEKKMNYEEFARAVEEKASEIFICLYSVLKSNLPSLVNLKRTALGAKKESSRALCSPTKTHRVALAKVLNKFVPTSEIAKTSRKLELIESDRVCLSARTGTGSESPEPRIVREQLFCECGQPIHDFERRLCKKCVLKRKGTKIEGYLLKPTRSKSTLGKFWIAIEHQEIYCYTDKSSSQYKCVHSLMGCIVREESSEQKGKVVLYPFTLHFANGKERRYYAMNKQHVEKWLFALRKNTSHTNIESYYAMKSEIGKGKFGCVSLGVHKKTGNKVAIKYMKKSVMSPLERELAYEEIAVLKVCQHPNLLRLYDVFESREYIYLVMEHLEGGDLMEYMERSKNKVPEVYAAKVIHSLAAALYYLHSYGIIHRDLKPENIMLKSKLQYPDVKIIDFGLAKFVGPKERCVEACGTLHYAAPELLGGLSYNKSADIWSLGVVAYLLLSGTFPFHHANDSKLTKMIVRDCVRYPSFCWRNVSAEGLDFVRRVLVKEPSRRMSLTEVLKHPWLMKDKEELRRMEKMNKFVAYTVVQPTSVLRALRQKSI